MAEVRVLPWADRPDLFKMPEPPHILQAAIENGLTDVIVIGRDRTGQFYVASSVGDGEKCLGMLTRASSIITSGPMVNDAFDTDEPEGA